MSSGAGHQAAYNFTGARGTSDYALATWSAAQAEGGTNLYRDKDAFYYLPTDDEWAKAAYWNGTTLQFWATKPGESVYQGDGVSGTGWNYFDKDPGPSPWDVSSGSEELNGTFNMMGNAMEWMENPYDDPAYGTGSNRSLRGGWRYSHIDSLACYSRGQNGPDREGSIGFRVASEVPEPAMSSLLALGGLAVLRRKRRLC